MTKAEFEDKIKIITDIIISNDGCNEKLGEIFGRDAIAENVFVEAIYRSLDIAIECLADLADDKGEWISWFVYECDCGRKPLRAFIGEIWKLCQNADDLWEIIHAKIEDDQQVRLEN